MTPVSTTGTPDDESMTLDTDIAADTSTPTLVTEVPDISEYVKANGHLSMAVPKASLFHRRFYNPKTGQPKEQYLRGNGDLVFSFYRCLEDDKQGNLKFNTSQPDDAFLDPNTGDFIPLLYDDQTFVMSSQTVKKEVKPDTALLAVAALQDEVKALRLEAADTLNALNLQNQTVSPSGFDQGNLIKGITEAMTEATRGLGQAVKDTNKSKSCDGMPSLTRWDGNHKTWHTWKDTFQLRLSRKGLKPPHYDDRDTYPLSEENNTGLYDELCSYIKIHDSTENSRRLAVIVKKHAQTQDGTAAWHALELKYERHNETLTEEIIDKLKALTLVNFPHKKHKGLYNVEDFFNQMQLMEMQLHEAGGGWEERDQYEVLRKAFRSTQRTHDVWFDRKRQYTLLGKKWNVTAIQKEMEEWYINTLPVPTSDSGAGTSLNTEAGGDKSRPVVGPCSSCGDLYHVSNSNKSCSKHKDFVPGQDQAWNWNWIWETPHWWWWNWFKANFDTFDQGGEIRMGQQT